jgi:hypothetical protein
MKENKMDILGYGTNKKDVNYDKDFVGENNYCAKEMPVPCEKCEFNIEEFLCWIGNRKITLRGCQKQSSSQEFKYNFKEVYSHCPLPKEPLRCASCGQAIDKFTQLADLQIESAKKDAEIQKLKEKIAKDFCNQISCDSIVQNHGEAIAKLNSELDERQKQFEYANTGWNKAMDKWQDLQRENNKLKSERDNIITELNSMGYILNDGKIYQRQPSINFHSTCSVLPPTDIKLTKDEIQTLYFCCVRVVETEKMNMFRMTLPRVQDMMKKLEGLHKVLEGNK